MSNKPIILGIGSSSRNILNNICRKEPDLKCLCIDENEDLQETQEVKTLLFRDFAGIGKTLKGKDNIVVIIPLGGEFGSSMGQHIVKYLINQNKEISLIVTTPFDYEGKKRTNAARSALKVLENMIFDMVIFNDNSIIGTLNSPVTVNEAFRIVDEIIYDILKEKFL